MNVTQKPDALVKAKRSVRDLISSPEAKAEIAKVLPKHLTAERMTRVALTATLRNPALLECRPESLMNALLVCSQAGLEPDGRLAHLIPYKDIVQVIFDYKGLVTLALRNGAEAVFADKVCVNDEFDAWVENGDKRIVHKINWRAERGEVIAFYAVCKRNGTADWEVMDLGEVHAIQGRSRAGQSGPWKTDFDEMGKKTVLRRMSKRWDLLPEIRDVMYADDDTPTGTQVTTVSRPIFSLPTPEAAVEQPEPSEPMQTAAASESQEGQGGGNLVKGARNLCKIAKIGEGDLLDFLSQTGATQGEVTSLEELATAYPVILEAVTRDWASTSAKIKEVRGDK